MSCATREGADLCVHVMVTTTPLMVVEYVGLTGALKLAIELEIMRTAYSMPASAMALATVYIFNCSVGLLLGEAHLQQHHGSRRPGTPAWTAPAPARFRARTRGNGCGLAVGGGSGGQHILAP